MKSQTVVIASLLVLGCADVADRYDRGSKPPVSSPVPSPEVATPEQVAAATFRSVVLLVIVDAAGQPLSQGSGFFVADGIVATNYHVIQEGSSGFAKPPGTDQQWAIQEVVSMDPDHDIALVRVEADAPPLRLAGGPLRPVGSTVYAVGNPQGLEGTFSEGIVSALRPLGADTILQITAPISPGSSGGPVLDVAGEVIGVATATYRGGQNLNFAVPVKHIRGALSNRKPVPFSSQTTPNTSSVVSSIGERATEGVVGESLQWAGEFEFQSDYTFSIRNRAQSAVRNVLAVVIFRDEGGLPIETDFISWPDVIPTGLARRVRSSVDPSIKRLTTRMTTSMTYEMAPSTEVEVRVLSFDFVR